MLRTRDHLFFICPYSQKVWSAFLTAVNLQPPADFSSLLNWMNIALIIKLAFQASLYSIWKERNSRLHFATSHLPTSIVEEIKRIFRARLHSLSRVLPNTLSIISYLTTWFSIF
ncbi:unnamed protein product [Thlaspi arvense]|uniref:Reverse transcriptase zinc-binding domain-containing protein n=1 Tax=Thlaspi arvense TaxID=13288 RepID=A0AAU9RPZ5_THLAR|nr:unnamed protein product [Thlaspi arvense]